MAAYMVFETGHTFGPSMLYPVYRLVDAPSRLLKATIFVCPSHIAYD